MVKVHRPRSVVRAAKALRELNPGIRTSQNRFISRAEQEQDGSGAGRRSPGEVAGKSKEPKPSSAEESPWWADRRVAVKDNIATAELPTTCASGILKNHQSPFEASVVEQLRSIGASIMGKTNMDEFGMGSHSTNSFFGTVTNRPPYNRFSVGGSSGGSAVAVADKLVDIAIGTDTGGSVRLPAAYSGVVGFKPSYGVISRWGVVPYANSLDTVGILARSCMKVFKAFVSMREHDPKDPTSLSEMSRTRAYTNGRNRWRDLRNQHDKDFHKLRIGVPEQYNIFELDGRTRRAWQRTLMLFQDQGCTIVPISLPSTEQALPAYYVLAMAEAASNLSKYDGVRYGTRSTSSDGAGDVLYSESRGQGFGDEVKRRILLGSYALSSDAIDNYFIKAQKVRRLVQQDFDRVFSMPNPLRDLEQFDLSKMDESIPLNNKLGPSQVDLIVCPTSPTPAPNLDDIANQRPVDAYINDVFTVPASMAGLPAISVPLKTRDADGPRFDGMQIIGQYSDDDRVISVAHELEKLLRIDDASGLWRKGYRSLMK
ncbi:Glutamyl-tRNA(Gln) amidotransferase subunit A, mitochondrial [Lachnellula occidentalis]|uniref:Glutamyl-tRNA(Gln) amidotransferase subunit A, mitochondrial n=1 Tax=Lachnellula occidentalis TaxID=215460 RepID=A0A8H8RXD0_9HELO|nr:Glutamyl-tRNA(Gln) amidotransferase subunit A, mitochondrial [Lachnellula occidentalis]